MNLLWWWYKCKRLYRCFSSFFFLEEEILIYQVGSLRKAVPCVICHFRELPPTNLGLVTQIMAEKNCLGGGGGGWYENPGDLKKRLPHKVFIRTCTLEAPHQLGAGYIRKEGRKKAQRKGGKPEEQGEEGKGPFFLEQKGNPNKIQTLFPTCGPPCAIFFKQDWQKKRKKRGFFILESTIQEEKGMFSS